MGCTPKHRALWPGLGHLGRNAEMPRPFRLPLPPPPSLQAHVHHPGPPGRPGRKAGGNRLPQIPVCEVDVRRDPTARETQRETEGRGRCSGSTEPSGPGHGDTSPHLVLSWSTPLRRQRHQQGSQLPRPGKGETDTQTCSAP